VFIYFNSTKVNIVTLVKDFVHIKCSLEQFERKIVDVTFLNSRTCEITSTDLRPVLRAKDELNTGNYTHNDSPEACWGLKGQTFQGFMNSVVRHIPDSSR
jgi:hypothetical protein